jgi:hypothetical protein
MSWMGLGLAFTCLLPRYGLSIPVVSELLTQMFSPAIIFAALMCFASWWQDRGNPLVISSFVAIFGTCIVLAVLTGGGRRAMLGVVLTAGVFAYWCNSRSLDRARITTLGGIFVSIAFFLMIGYNQVRHFDRGSRSQERTASNAISALARMPERLMRTDFLDKRVLTDIGQDTTNVSLYSIHLSKRLHRENHRTGLVYPSYFHNILYLVTNPIPRRFWSGKPNGLGFMLPKQLNFRAKVNWGPGIVGHSYHEGGMWMAIFYGLLIGYVTRSIDHLLFLDPSNLFTLAFVSAVFPHLVMFVRGDIGLVLLNIVFALVVFVVLRFIGLKIFGTDAFPNVGHLPQS